MSSIIQKNVQKHNFKEGDINKSYEIDVSMVIDFNQLHKIISS